MKQTKKTYDSHPDRTDAALCRGVEYVFKNRLGYFCPKRKPVSEKSGTGFVLCRSDVALLI